jgi:hypothetical protein
LDIVIAHCGESLEWLSSVPPPARIFIYAKCGTSSLPAFDRFAHFQVLELPNMGMESLAYASHIVRVADRDIVPGQYTLFLQGAPFEHAVSDLLLELWDAAATGRLDAAFVHVNHRRFLAGRPVCLVDLHGRLGLGEAPEAFASYCCSQFIVRADRLLIHENAVRLAREALLGNLPLLCGAHTAYDARPGIAVSALFESMWPTLFGEPSQLPPRERDERLPLSFRSAEEPPLP